MKRYILAALVLISVMAVSCKEAPALKIESQTLEVAAAGGNISVTLDANYAWHASTSSSWISITAKTGDAGAGTLSFKVTPNRKTQSREGEITVTCESLVKTVKVVQKAMDVIDLSVDTWISVSAEEQTIPVDVSASVEFEISKDVDWLSVTRTKAAVEGSLSVEIAANEQSSPRTGLITLSAVGSDVVTTLEITQAGRQQSFTIVHERDVFNAPVVFGIGGTAVINWGDDTVENYSNTAVHTYLKPGEHSVVINSVNTSSVSVTDLTGIKLIDVTNL